jgi:putative membrane protein
MRAESSGPRLFGIDLRKALIRLVINTIAVLVAAKLIDGIHLRDWQGAVLAGAILGIINTFIKPVVKALTCPLYLLTLGLFALIVNGVLLAFTSWIAEQLKAGFKVDGFSADVLGALVISIVSWIVSMVFSDA